MRSFLYRGVILLFCFVCINCCKEENNYIDEGETDRYIEGKVYDEDSGSGIPDIVVSDGYSTTLTDEDGSYKIEANSDAYFIFISLPSGYEIPEEEGIAKFYEEIDDNQEINFSLQKDNLDDAKYGIIAWADPQIKSSNTAGLLKTEVAPAVVDFINEELNDMPLFGITLGDIVGEEFDLFPDYIEAVESIGIPFFQVVGNHDLNYEVASQKSAEKYYRSYFGPTYYSFNRGEIHFVILNNVLINYDGTAVDSDDEYDGYFFDEQISWLEKDLSYIEEGSTVIVAFHIPYFKLSDDVKSEFAEIIKPYNVHILTGHTHYNKNIEDSEYEHNTAAVCASWWNSETCTDGTPAGYGVYIVDGNDISWYYKSTKLETDYQVKLYAPGYSDLYPSKVIANVWNWDSEWQVEWYEDGVLQGEMTNFSGYEPDAYNKMYGSDLPAGHTNIEPSTTNHLFYAVPSNTAINVSVKVTDRYGNVYTKDVDIE